MQGLAVPPTGSQQSLLSGGTAPIAEHSVLTPADFRKILIKRKWIILLGLP